MISPMAMDNAWNPRTDQRPTVLPNAVIPYPKYKTGGMIMALKSTGAIGAIAQAHFFPILPNKYVTSAARKVASEPKIASHGFPMIKLIKKHPAVKPGTAA